MTHPFDVAIVGAGGAGQTLLLALAVADLPLRVAVVDPVVRAGHDRTWCWWGADAGLVGPAVDAQWRHVRLAGGGLPEATLDLHPLAYRLIRSGDLYDLVDRAVAKAARLRVERIVAPVHQISGADDEVRVVMSDGAVGATWAFDSRPSAPASPGRVWWWQQFLGWVLPATAVPGLGGVPLLMDFRTRQPPDGLSFGYCLPMSDGTVLVEYTEFSPDVMDPIVAAAALGDYVRLLGGVPPFVASHVETGSIPMTDAHFARQVHQRVFRLGTAGGATRGSTGYTFAAMLRQADRVAAALTAGRTPRPPHAYPPRHRWMDAVMLRALADRELSGPVFFRRLFDRQPAHRVLRFLDGATNPAEELAVMSAAPLRAMTRSALRSMGPVPAGSAHDRSG